MHDFHSCQKIFLQLTEVDRLYIAELHRKFEGIIEAYNIEPVEIFHFWSKFKNRSQFINEVFLKNFIELFVKVGNAFFCDFLGLDNIDLVFEFLREN